MSTQLKTRKTSLRESEGQSLDQETLKVSLRHYEDQSRDQETPMPRVFTWDPCPLNQENLKAKDLT